MLRMRGMQGNLKDWSRRAQSIWKLTDPSKAKVTPRKDDGFKPLLEYTIKKGDTLGSIAKQKLGNAKTLDRDLQTK